LKHILQIKAVNPANQNSVFKPPTIQLLPKFANNGPNSKNLIQLKYGQIFNDGFGYPSYGRNKESLDDSFDRNGKNDLLPNFKAANSFISNIPFLCQNPK